MRLKLDEIGFSFGNRMLLRGASLSLRSPGLFCIMGPSGSGKSTLLAIIAGRRQPDVGLVTIDDLDRSAQNDVGWIVQSSPLLNRRTALENVMLGPLSRGMSRGKSAAVANETMARLDIDRLADQRALSLSGGERQRVAVARAIAMETRLVLADEPTASLDLAACDAVCDALAEAKVAGALVIVATHDPHVSARCDATFTLANGRIERT